MKLSIITINYNNIAGLRRTMESVFSQTWRDFEYIIIDGGSTDGSADEIRQHEHNCAYAVSEPDCGIYNAMNKGIKQAKGEYCLFLNSGDFLYHKDVLKQAFSVPFTSEIVSLSLLNTDGKSTFLKKPPCAVSLFTFVYGNISHPSTFIRRELFDRVGLYDESYKIISDWAWFVQALVVHHVSYAYQDTILSVFDRSGVSISSQNGDVAQNERQDFLRKNIPAFYADYFMKENYVNAMFFLIKKLPPMVTSLIFLPLTIINRVFHLRNRLRKTISSEKVDSTPLM